MESWLFILQLVANFLLLLTVFVYFLQWKTMQRQLDSSREQLAISQRGLKAQNLFALISYIQEPEARDARAWVMQKLKGKPLEEWTADDKNFASRVCSKYDVVGIVVREGMVPSTAVVGSWGPSIASCYEILRPFIAVMKEKNGQAYWDDFDWLYREAATSLQGSQ